MCLRSCLDACVCVFHLIFDRKGLHGFLYISTEMCISNSQRSKFIHFFISRRQNRKKWTTLWLLCILACKCQHILLNSFFKTPNNFWFFCLSANILIYFFVHKCVTICRKFNSIRTVKFNQSHEWKLPCSVCLWYCLSGCYCHMVTFSWILCYFAVIRPEITCYIILNTYTRMHFILWSKKTVWFDFFYLIFYQQLFNDRK